MRSSILSASLFLCIVLPLSANAMNLRFLKDAPIAKMNSADFGLMSKAADKALTDAKDNESINWQNPETGSRGTLTPLSTYKAHNTTCRKLKLFNEAGGVSASNEIDCCLAGDGKWKILK